MNWGSFLIFLVGAVFVIALVWKPTGRFFMLLWEQAAESNNPLTYLFILVFIGSLVTGFFRPELSSLSFWSLVGLWGFIWMAIRRRKERDLEK